MKFYRVCHETETRSYGAAEVHAGPYLSLKGPPEMAGAHTGTGHHPDVSREFDDYIGYGCGFTSWEQFERWFSEEWRERLDARGFVLRVFELDSEDVQVGEFQSIARLTAISAADATVLALIPTAFPMSVAA